MDIETARGPHDPEDIGDLLANSIEDQQLLLETERSPGREEQKHNETFGQSPKYQQSNQNSVMRYHKGSVRKNMRTQIDHNDMNEQAYEGVDEAVKIATTLEQQEISPKKKIIIKNSPTKGKMKIKISHKPKDNEEEL